MKSFRNACTSQPQRSLRYWNLPYWKDKLQNQPITDKPAQFWQAWLWLVQNDNREDQWSSRGVGQGTRAHKTAEDRAYYQSRAKKYFGWHVTRSDQGIYPRRQEGKRRESLGTRLSCCLRTCSRLEQPGTLSVRLTQLETVNSHAWNYFDSN